MFLYVASQIDRDGLVKIGITSSVRDRLGNYNASSRFAWWATFWKLEKSWEIWEAKVLRHLNEYRCVHSYGKETFNGPDVVRDSHRILARAGRDAPLAAMMFHVIAAVAANSPSVDNGHSDLVALGWIGRAYVTALHETDKKMFREYVACYNALENRIKVIMPYGQKMREIFNSIGGEERFKKSCRTY